MHATSIPTTEHEAITGAEAIARTFEASGIDVCFANPGTTELHLVAGMERHSGIRMVLALFEGVATGAADGYARMSGMPAATLLHLGPGLSNGIANLHNARRSRSPIVNLVGDHATHHLRYDPPLASDIERLAGAVSGWVRRVAGPSSAGPDAAEAVAAARAGTGRVATLIVPSDAAWGRPAAVAAPIPPEPPAPVRDADIAAARAALSGGGPALLLLGGAGLNDAGLTQAARISAATGCDLLAQTSNPRIERGAGRPAVERVPYAVTQALDRLRPYRRVILAGASEPVGFFAYPELPSRLLPEEAEVIVLAGPDQDVVEALRWLAEEVGAPAEAPASRATLPPLPRGPLTREAIGAVLANALVEDAIVSDESITTGRAFFAATHGAPPHTWLQLTGGAIGDGLPTATGAAIACPDRKVIALQADGSGMYTLQSLWTQAREGLDVTTVIFANRSYRILRGEMAAAAELEPGERSLDLVRLDRPAIDWVALARGIGVEGERVSDSEGLTAGLRRGLAGPGPYLVEAVF